MEATVSPRPEMVASGAMRPFLLILVVALPVVLPLKPLPCSTRPEPSRPRQTVSLYGDGEARARTGGGVSRCQHSDKLIAGPPRNRSIWANA